MEDVTLPRTEWVAVARQLDSTSRGAAPSGLRSRIAGLLADTPAVWGEEPCTLDLDPPAAAIVRSIVRRGRGLPVAPERARERSAGIAEAEDVIHNHQTRTGNPSYRIEHRTGDDVTVLGHTTATRARQADLSEHASRLMATGATGELVLVDDVTGEDVARRRLLSSPDADPDCAGPTT
jgi:hypothetical protein